MCAASLCSPLFAHTSLTYGLEQRSENDFKSPGDYGKKFLPANGTLSLRGGPDLYIWNLRTVNGNLRIGSYESKSAHPFVGRPWGCLDLES